MISSRINALMRQLNADRAEEAAEQPNPAVAELVAALTKFLQDAQHAPATPAPTSSRAAAFLRDVTPTVPEPAPYTPPPPSRANGFIPGKSPAPRIYIQRDSFGRAVILNVGVQQFRITRDREGRILGLTPVEDAGPTPSVKPSEWSDTPC